MHLDLTTIKGFIGMCMLTCPKENDTECSGYNV